MKTIDALQGSQEWLAARAQHFTASEAPAMMGASKYTTRSELLRQKAAGITDDVDANKQRLFDRGHVAEAAARPLVEAIIGESLYPVTGSLEVDGLPLLASFDGLTAMDDIVWETKLWNAALADAVRAGDLAPHYYWQIEQQLLVSGAAKAYFTTTDGTPDNTVGMWYESLPERRAALIAGWKQFAADHRSYQHVEVAERPAAAVTIELPALFIHAKGEITESNMVAYGEALKDKLAEVRAIVLATDQDFSNAKAAAAMFREQRNKLKLAKEAMLSQTVTIGEAARMMDAWSEDLRVTALKLEKDVEREDAAKKAAIVSGAKLAHAEHIKALNVRLGGQYMPYSVTSPNFAEAIKGKRNYGSMTDAVDAMLANAKVSADMTADLIAANRFEMESELDWSFLFPDFAAVCTKARDDFNSLLMARIAKHNEAQAAKDAAAKAAEDSRIAAAVEAERKAGEARAAEAARIATADEAERIRKEEAARGQLTQENDQRGKAEPVGGTVPAIASTPPIQQSDMGQSLDGAAGKSVRAPTADEKRAVLVEAGDDVREYLNTLGLNDKEFGRMRAVIMGFIQFQAARGLKVAA